MLLLHPSSEQAKEHALQNTALTRNLEAILVKSSARFNGCEGKIYLCKVDKFHPHFGISTFNDPGALI
jgi:hypothetical protein